MRVIRKVKKIFRKMNMAKHYDPKLIDELKKEHNILFNIFTKINDNYEKENFEQVLKLLKEFQTEFLEHIEFEDEYFYPYVKTKYKYVPETLKIIEEKQSEMLNITDTVKKFAENYATVEKIKNESFKKNLQQIGEALTNRVKFEEETLYLYY